LAANASFEEVAYLLLLSKKPTTQELKNFQSELITERKLPDLVVSFLSQSGELVNNQAAVPMDILRTAVSMLGHLDAQCQDNSADANLNKSKRLLAKIPTIIGHMQNSID
ncbi:MAG TPA: bifunctional 2-methylcitrate synthase/citrate synthase, partial [Phycisphaerales bacterium]|nr:bifunctional 2-methylcitrate synthase/citrate synthase [Phycisphaerales bacterium]